MTSLKQVHAAITDFYESACDAVSTIGRGIDNFTIALERLDDEICAAEASEKRAAKEVCHEEIDTQDEGEEMSRVLGRIVFEENAMHRAVRQSWNPSQLDKKHRLEIADVLTEIAEHLRNDEFEVNGKYKKLPHELDTGMSNRIAKYLEPDEDDDSKRVIASVCALLAIDAIHHNFRQTTWNELPDHLKPDVQAIYNSFCGESLSLILSAEFYKQFFAAMNSMGDVVTARYNEMKGSK